MSTLVILLGNPRGGEEAWHSMYRHLLDVYEADLSLMFGKESHRVGSLYAKAKYVWELPEYDDWATYYNEVLTGDNWYRSFMRGATSGLAGGLTEHRGSGSIVFAFRHCLRTRYREVLRQYDRLILTRADYFYVQPHPRVDNEHVWVVEGEDYGGICDRHHVFPSCLMDEVLGVVEYLNGDGTADSIPLDSNAETVLALSWKHYGIWNKVRRIPRVQFTVCVDGDTTRWCPPGRLLPGSDRIFLKYITEYRCAMRNMRTAFGDDRRR